MIIKITSVDNQISTSISNNGKDEEFDYIKIINAIYNKEEIELSCENIDDEQKHKIEEVFKEIQSTVKQVLVNDPDKTE